jgi:hypothetical protein
MHARELKKYAIRPVFRPTRNPCLSSTVQVIGEGGEQGYCYIAFAEELVEAVGEKLTRGIAAFDPAFLVVTYNTVRRVWEVSARYLRGTGQALLWETPDRPAWLKIFKNKRANHDSSSQTDTAGYPDPGSEAGTRRDTGSTGTRASRTYQAQGRGRSAIAAAG